jgi:hypothetical protein
MHKQVVAFWRAQREFSLMKKVLSLALSLSLTLGLFLAAGVQPAFAASFTVNETATDAPDVTVGDGLCQTSGGVCTLRATTLSTCQRRRLRSISLAPQKMRQQMAIWTLPVT